MARKKLVPGSRRAVTPAVARDLKAAGIGYTGISLDGARVSTHDAIRGVPGSFDRAVAGMHSCVEADLACGLRVTATRENAAELPAMLALARDIGIRRFCLYWLVPSGRGLDAAPTRQLSPDSVRTILDLLYRAAREIEPEEMEILTVDAPQDAAYILERIRRDDPDRYPDALRDAEAHARCSAGDRVVNIDPSGHVYPCQFAQQPAFLLGDVCRRSFPEIWHDRDGLALRRFGNGREGGAGPCGSCAARALCGAGCRVRAGEGGGDPFCPGPVR